jgi:branched-chain amino acid transport system substrate-binding protein
MSSFSRTPRRSRTAPARRRLRSRRTSFQLIGLVAALTLFALLGARATHATASKAASGLPSRYKIGVNMALTGATAPYDQPALAGLKMAVAEINAKGGIGGKSKIVLSIRNDRSDAGQAAADSQTLAAQGINFMMLPGDPSTSIPAGTVAQSHHIPMMTCLASLPTQRKAIGPYFFGGESADNVVAAAEAVYAVHQGWKTAYTLVGPDNAYTENYPKYFAKAFKAAGGKVLGTTTWRSGTTDFSPQIQKIKKLHPQPAVIESSMYEPDLPAFIKQLRAAGVHARLLQSDASDTPTIEQLGKLVNGLTFSTLGFPTPHSKLAGFYTRFKKRYGHQPPNVLAAVCYDSMYLIADAVAKAGTTTPATVVKTLNSVKHNNKGVLGATTYSNGFPLRPIAMQKWVWNANKHKLHDQFLAFITPTSKQVPAP